MDTPHVPDTPDPSLEAFKRTLKGILAVPKKDIDESIKQEREERKAAKQSKQK